MTALREDIRQWFREGVSAGCTHMIVMCDTFSFENYPVYVFPDKDAREIAKKHSKASLQKMEEVYNLKLDREKQLSSPRVMNF